jgi:hypothetical protein
MRYLCLIYNSADVDGRLSQSETDALVRDHFGFDEGLRQDGTLIHCDALETPEEAVVLRLREGRLTVTDGPYVETKEHLAGFYVIEAADIERATEIVGRIPSARFGAVELRPIRILTLPE